MARALSPWPGEEGADPRLLGYLDRLCEPLERTLSRDEIAEYRLQALGHLERLAAELVEFDGLTPGESVDRALREYGQPERLAIGVLDEHGKGSRPVGFARGARSSTLWSFVWFGLASAASLLLGQTASLVPGMAWLAPYALAGCWMLPVLAGVLCGLTVPTGNLRAVAIALTILVVHATATTLFTDGPDTGTTLVRLQALAWPPLGCAATYLTALLRRRPRFSSNDRLTA